MYLFVGSSGSEGHCPDIGCSQWCKNNLPWQVRESCRIYTWQGR